MGWQAFWQAGLGLISCPRCPLCGSDQAPAALPGQFCQDCRWRLALPLGGLQGDAPLLWCGLARYGGELRRLVLAQRRRPQAAVLQALALELLRCCSTAIEASQLVPIPGWKRSGGNPLPLALATALVARHPGRLTLAAEVLQRRRASVGQHHLDRQQRLENLSGAFVCGCPPCPSQRQSLWLVDDILTTGATAQAAAAALVSAGWQVDGLLCLARTASSAGL